MSDNPVAREAVTCPPLDHPAFTLVKMMTAVRTLIPCAEIAADMLRVIDKKDEAAKIDKVVAFSQKFLDEAGTIQ